MTDPRRLLSEIETLSRFRFIESGDDGELWDVYLDSGTVHLGGRVLITSPDKNRMQWKSVSDAVWSLATWKPSPRKSGTVSNSRSSRPRYPALFRSIH